MTELSPALFAIFASLIEQACGLHYGAQDRKLFTTKLVAHATEHGHDALLDYYYKLRYDDPAGVEIARLVEALLGVSESLLRFGTSLTCEDRGGSLFYRCAR